VSAADQLRVILREQAGLDLVTLVPTSDGESKSAFWATDRAGTTSILKVDRSADRRGSAETLGRLRALDTVLDRLRDRGYPAPRFRAIGQLPGLVFWLQEPLPGSPLDGRPDRLDIADALRLNDAQAGLGVAIGQDSWPDLIAQTLAQGGDGYCLHATFLSKPGTGLSTPGTGLSTPGTGELLGILREIGDRCCAAIPAGHDFVHFDFTLANLLSDQHRDKNCGPITGVIDINPPLLAGDRAFDLATILFYLYDHDDFRSRLWKRILELTDLRAARAYLAHMVLRQVEWSLRHYPTAAITRHHLHLAHLVVTDIR
jgi:hypothetical protein